MGRRSTEEWENKRRSAAAVTVVITIIAGVCLWWQAVFSRGLRATHAPASTIITPERLPEALYLRPQACIWVLSADTKHLPLGETQVLAQALAAQLPHFPSFNPAFTVRVESYSSCQEAALNSTSQPGDTPALSNLAAASLPTPIESETPSCPTNAEPRQPEAVLWKACKPEQRIFSDPNQARKLPVETLIQLSNASLDDWLGSISIKPGTAGSSAWPTLFLLAARPHTTNATEDDGQSLPPMGVMGTHMAAYVRVPDLPCASQEAVMSAGKALLTRMMPDLAGPQNTPSLLPDLAGAEFMLSVFHADSRDSQPARQLAVSLARQLQHALMPLEKLIGAVVSSQVLAADLGNGTWSNSKQARIIPPSSLAASAQQQLGPSLRGEIPHWRVVHFVAYVPSPAAGPLLVEGCRDASLGCNSFFVRDWGGLLVVNARADAPPGLLEDAPAVFGAHLRALFLGYTNPNLGRGLRVLRRPDGQFSDWEAAAVARKLVAANVERATGILRALGPAGELGSLQLPHAARPLVEQCMSDIRGALRAVDAGSLQAAVRLAVEAHESAAGLLLSSETLARDKNEMNHYLAIYGPFLLPVFIVALQGVVLQLRPRAKRAE